MLGRFHKTNYDANYFIFRYRQFRGRVLRLGKNGWPSVAVRSDYRALRACGHMSNLDACVKYASSMYKIDRRGGGV